MKSHLRSFKRSERGTMSVEAVLVFPLLMWAYAAMFIYWDAFKTQNVNLKATYTVADLVSRQPNAIVPAFITGSNQVYRFLIRKYEGNDIRVTSIKMITNPSGDPLDPPVHELKWSSGTGLMGDRTDLVGLTSRLPVLSLGDQLIVVESRMTWSPPLSFTLEPIGLDTMQFENMVFTSPRGQPVLWDGNGDGIADDTW